MKREYPLITIAMAVYEPNADWLSRQLDSLNQQDYPNLELRILDDASSSTSFEQLKKSVEELIIAFPYFLDRNRKNAGSNKAFEKLTVAANGTFIAYCDQDDIWLKDKITRLYLAVQGATMAYCDMSIINGNGKLVAEHLKKIRPRIHFASGEHLESSYAFFNCTAGCSMLIKTSIAKKAVPFPEGTVCDQWLCMVAAHFGRIVFISESLVQYRQHRHNQTGILTGIETKQDYLEKRTAPMVYRVEEFDKRFGAPENMLQFARARKNQHLFNIWKYRTLCKKDAYFEVAMKCMPKWLFRRLINRIKG